MTPQRAPIFCLLLLFFTVKIYADTLRIGNGAEPNSLDPQLAGGVPEENILVNLVEGLVTKDPKTLAPRPGVAERWTLSKDQKTYHFYLRKNAVWSNGDKLTAEDFVYSWRRLTDKATASEYQQHGFYLKNGKKFSEGKLAPNESLGVKALGPYELKVTLENPTAFFLSLLEHHSFAPLHRKTLESFPRDWTKPEHFVGNGAFILSEWKPNNFLTIKPNKNYWDKKSVQLEAVQFFPISDLGTEEKMFRAGQLEVTRDIPIEKIPNWKKDTTGVFQSYPYLGVYFYALNKEKPPLDNVKVRKALALAIDRKEITQFGLYGNTKGAQSLTPPGTGGYFPKPLFPLADEGLAEAKKLLAESGYGPGKPIPPVEILYNTNATHQKIAEIIQAAWKKNLGIEVTLLNQDWKVVLDNVKHKKYVVARRSWIANYNDPLTFLELFTTGGSRNNTGFARSDYDAEIEKAGREISPAKRYAAFDRAEAILFEEMPVIPIYYYQRSYLKSSRVLGWATNIEGKQLLKYVRLKPR